MSRHHIEKVTCPSCHHEGDFELWDSINTALDPEMKEKVLNQSIFLYTCPSCGETFRLNYSTYTAEELRDAQRTKIIDSKVMDI